MGLTQLLRKITTGSTVTTPRITDEAKPVNITLKLNSITVQHHGEEVVIERNQDTHARITDLFAKTSRPCPPFCVQPMSIAKGVETLGELEVLDYIQRATTDDSLLLIDSRIKEWVDIGTIPSATHIPWTSLTLGNGITLKSVIALLRETFGVKVNEGVNAGEMSEAFANGNISEKLDFSDAKTLILFCNGNWCNQTPEAILSLLELAYPADKIKYYRDGIQGWLSLGLTTVSDDTSPYKKIACDTITPVCKNKPNKILESID